jgi:hypothetical protein
VCVDVPVKVLQGLPKSVTYICYRSKVGRILGKLEGESNENPGIPKKPCPERVVP